MNNEIIYIGIAGLAGSGKDTFGDMLMDNVGDHIIPHRIALADPLKRTVAELYGVDLDSFYNRDKKEKSIHLNEGDEYDTTTPRKMLQHFGTEVVRKMDADHWVKRFDTEVKDVIFGSNKYMSGIDEYMGNNLPHIEYNYTKDAWKKYKEKLISTPTSSRLNLVIVPDIRFENEQQMIKDKGGYLIEISRNDLAVGKMDFNHASETSIDIGIQSDFYINNNMGLSHLFIESIAVLNSLGLR